MPLYGNQWFGLKPEITGWNHTEADADSNTFIIEFSGTSGANETGAGYGMSGTDLVGTKGTGTIGASSGGYRQFSDAAMGLSQSATGFFNNWLPRTNSRKTYSWAMQLKDVARDSNNAYFNWIGGSTGARADAAMYCAHTATNTIRFIWNAGNSSMATNTNLDATGMGTDTYVWLASWSDGTTVRAGWVENATEQTSPTVLSDFPSTQRFSVNWEGDGANNNYWNYDPLYFYSYGNAGGAGIGFNNGNSHGNFKIKKFVASKLTIIDNSS